MKILILTNHQSGLYSFRRELLERFVKDGHQVYVSVPDDGYTDKLEKIGVSVLNNAFLDRRGTNPIADLRLAKHWKTVLKEVSPDIVFTYTIKPNVYGGYLCGKQNIPYVANVTGLGSSIQNGGMLQRLTLLMYKNGLKHAQRVFFQNNDNCEFMQKRKAVTSPYTVLPGSGVNLSQHKLEPYPAENNGVILTYVGRLMRDKGTLELVGAAREIKKRHPDILIRLIGSFEDDCEEIVRTAEKEGVIQYISEQEDVHPWMAESHAVVMPSYHEGMNNVILEAAATGRPVLCSDIPGCREAVDDKKSGILFKAKSRLEIEAAIEEFLKLSNEQKSAMGIAGRKKVEKEFDRDIIVSEYIKEIERVEDRR